MLRAIVSLLCCLVVISAASALGHRPSPIEEQRQRMVRVIERHADEPLDARVLKVMAEVPRHEFVPPARRGAAYEDTPLPIGFGQTISQPFIVGFMTDLIDPEPTDVVLEVGTGSGYQAAVLAQLVDRVCTIEIIPELARRAATALDEIGYDNITTRIGDGYFGWPDCGPYDAIVVTAAAASIPPPLLEQLKPTGRMVIPVGGPFLTQQLVVAVKEEDGTIRTRQVLPVRFVPLRREP